MLDASLTLLRRMARGEPWWQAHVQHAYQRWARGAGTHVPVTLAYALSGVIAVALMLNKGHHTRLILLAWCATLILAWWRLQRRYRDR